MYHKENRAESYSTHFFSWYRIFNTWMCCIMSNQGKNTYFLKHLTLLNHEYFQNHFCECLKEKHVSTLPLAIAIPSNNKTQGLLPPI